MNFLQETRQTWPAFSWCWLFCNHFLQRNVKLTDIAVAKRDNLNWSSIRNLIIYNSLIGGVISGEGSVQDPTRASILDRRKDAATKLHPIQILSAGSILILKPYTSLNFDLNC